MRGTNDMTLTLVVASKACPRSLFFLLGHTRAELKVEFITFLSPDPRKVTYTSAMP